MDSKLEDHTKKDNENNRLIHGIILFVMFIAGEYVGDLFNCKPQYYLENNRFIKYGIALLIIYSSMLSFNSYKKSPHKVFLESLIVFIGFILFSRMNIYFTLLAILVLIVIFIIENYINYYKELNEEEKMIKLKKVNRILYIPFSIIIIIGFIYYLFQKRLEYKKGFNWFNFVFGIKKCKQT